MQKTSTVCDRCNADDVPPGFVVVNVAGDRAATVKGQWPGGRPALDICDRCAASLAGWANGRELVPVPEPEPEHVAEEPQAPAPDPAAPHAEDDPAPAPTA